MTRTKASAAPSLAERLGAAVDYLEARLPGEVDLDQAARRAGFSRWHFMRLFQAASGLPVAEYVRKRRLSRAAEALRQGERLLEVALGAGYESQAAFTRAFKRAFGLAPGRYLRAARAGGRLAAPVTPFEPRLPFALAGPPRRPALVEKPAFRVVGLSTRASLRRYQTFTDLPAFWTDWLARERWREVRGALPGRPSYGLSRCDADGWVEYVIGLETEPGARAPRGWCDVEVEAGRYAVFQGRGPPSRVVQELILGAYVHWLPGSGLSRGWGVWDVEAYYQPRRPAEPMREEVWIPVVEDPERAGTSGPGRPRSRGAPSRPGR